MWSRKAAVLVGLALVAMAAGGAGAAAGPQSALPAPQSGADLIQARCGTCHADDLIRQQRLTRDGWARELDKMVAWGAAVTPDERPLLLDALAPESVKTAGDAAATVLLERRCQACHDLRLIDQQRLDVAGWTREIDKMIAWGAAVTPAEKAVLAALLVQRQAGVLPYRP